MSDKTLSERVSEYLKLSESYGFSGMLDTDLLREQQAELTALISDNAGIVDACGVEATENAVLTAKNARLTAELEEFRQRLTVEEAHSEKYRAELESLALYKSLVDEYGLSIFAELESARKDAERYRKIRMCDWYESPLAVVRNPKSAVMPGHDCPSGTRLDEFVDAITKDSAR